MACHKDYQGPFRGLRVRPYVTSTPPGNAAPLLPTKVLLRCLSEHRLSTYLDHCRGDVDQALALYEWNTSISGAVWEVFTHVEVALRNVLATCLDRRHERHSRQGSWLDDPAGDLDNRARDDIAEARRRVRRTGHSPSDAQTISELSFGFWRFLIARRYTNLWPDLATGFPHAPNRSRTTVEDPVARLHALRNRVAHHHRIWNEPLADLYADMFELLGFIDPDLARWVDAGSRLAAVLAARPAPSAAT